MACRECHATTAITEVRSITEFKLFLDLEHQHYKLKHTAPSQPPVAKTFGTHFCSCWQLCQSLQYTTVICVRFGILSRDIVTEYITGFTTAPQVSESVGNKWQQ
jgi:hypothetical protein